MTPADRFTVTFLGTRDAAVRPGAHTSSQLVSLGDSDVLVDAGLGAAVAAPRRRDARRASSRRSCSRTGIPTTSRVCRRSCGAARAASAPQRPAPDRTAAPGGVVVAGAALGLAVAARLEARRRRAGRVA